MKMALIYSNMQLSEVVQMHTSLIPLLNRFGITLGLGDRTVHEICEAHGLDTEFFLTVINTFLNEDYFPEKKLQSFHTTQIIDYLTKTNNYYLRFQLPNIERHLNSFISVSDTENPSLTLIGKFFLSFKEELISRIEQDGREWFPYCLRLSERINHRDGQGSLNPFHPKPEEEDPIEALLADLKSIMIKHLSGRYDPNLCYAVLFSLSSLEKDIKQHNRIRRRILSPMVELMETQTNSPS